MNYIDSTPIISDYIHDCGSCDWNLESEVKEVQGSYGRLILHWVKLIAKKYEMCTLF